MICEWTRFLTDNAAKWGLPVSGKWDYLFYNNYHPHIMAIILLWFHEGAIYPQAVTKLFREDEVPKREYENLKRAHASAPDCAPEPLALAYSGSFCGLWMKGMPGRRMERSRDCSADALKSMAAMIADLHRALSGTDGNGSPDRHRRAVVEPLAALARFGESAPVREGCEKLASAASRSWIESLPVIPQHGDLYLGNLLRDDGRWHVVDWESFGSIDLPFHDLATLILSSLSGDAMIPSDWTPHLAAETPGLVRLYCDRLMLPREQVRLLLPLSLANWFHLQLRDGRQKFAQRMYRTIADYFEHAEAWEKVFVSL